MGRVNQSMLLFASGTMAGLTTPGFVIRSTFFAGDSTTGFTAQDLTGLQNLTGFELGTERILEFRSSIVRFQTKF